MSPTSLLNSSNYCLISSTTEPSSTVIATSTGGDGGPLGDQIPKYILIGAGCGIGLLLCLNPVHQVNLLQMLQEDQ